MAVTVVVRRGAGTHPGEDITDPLIATLSVALQRGRNELDARAHGLQEVELEFPFRPGIRLGQVIEVEEVLFGTTWYGKIDSISHTYSIPQAVTRVTVKRPTEFTV